MLSGNALLSELAASIAAGLEDGDLSGYLASWARVASGEVTGRERYGVVPGVLTSQPGGGSVERKALAVRMVAAKGKVTSRELAELAQVGTEAARLDLVALARSGVLVKQGAYRSSHYVRA